jgi:hypothetical protein
MHRNEREMKSTHLDIHSQMRLRFDFLLSNPRVLTSSPLSWRSGGRRLGFRCERYRCKVLQQSYEEERSFMISELEEGRFVRTAGSLRVSLSVEDTNLLT